MPDTLTKIPRQLQDSYLLLWDGDCEFCCRSVEWLEKKAPGKFIALPYQDQSTRLLSEVWLDCKNQFYVQTPQRNYAGGGDAVIILLDLAGWKRLSRVLGLPGFRQLTRLAYRTVARNRILFSKCLFHKK